MAATNKEAPLIDQPLWIKKFQAWKTLKQSCPCAAGLGGLYCLWEGRNCGYSLCPRRIFEETMENSGLIVEMEQMEQKIESLNKIIEDMKVVH